jgi:hypothetical protein
MPNDIADIGEIRLERLSYLKGASASLYAPDSIVQRWISGEYLHRRKASAGYNYIGLALAYCGAYRFQSYNSQGKKQTEGLVRILIRDGELAMIGRRMSRFQDAAENSVPSYAEFDSVFSELYTSGQKSQLAVIFGLVERSDKCIDLAEPHRSTLETLAGDRLLTREEKQKNQGLIWLDVTEHFRDGEIARRRGSLTLSYQFLTALGKD